MGKLRRKRRNYHGNPLAYFKEHENENEYIGRRAFALKDCGLYRSLLRAGQLEKAIGEDLRINSKGKEPLSNDKITILVNLYSIHNGNACKAAKDSRYCVPTLLKYWRERELEIRKRGRPEQSPDDVIVSLYELHNGNANQASKNSNYCIVTIIRHWRRKKLKIRKRGRPRDAEN